MQKVSTVSPKKQAEFRYPRIELEPHARSVILPADALDALLTQRRRPGPDTGAPVLRWLCWIALRCAESGQACVFASAAKVSRDFRGLRPGGQARIGMSERSLTRARPMLLPHVHITNDGRYRTKRSRRFYALDQGITRRLVFETDNAALRAALGALSALAAAAERPTVRARARGAARRLSMGTTRWCRAMRSLRRAGLIHDNRPGRKWTFTKAEGARRPERRISTRSPLAPLRRDRIVWASGQVGHAKPDTKPEAILSSVGDPNQRGSAAVGCAEAPSSTASPSSSSADVETPSSQTSAVSAAALASPPPPTQSTFNLASSRLLDRPAITRRALAELGYPEAWKAGADTVGDIAKACVTVADLRQVIAAERDVLDTRTYPLCYLAAVCRAEGQAVRSPSWPGSYARRGQRQALALEVERRAVVDERTEAELAAERETTARELEREHRERRLAADVRATAERVTTAWPAWKLAVMRADIDPAERRLWCAPLRVRERQGAVVHVVCPDESHAAWCAGDSGIGRALLRALAELAGVHTLVLEDGCARCVAVVVSDGQETTPMVRAGRRQQRNQAPEADDQAPEVDDQAPEVDDQAPEVDDQAPEVDDQAPEVDDQDVTP